MKSLQEIQELLSQYKPTLREKYKWLSELGIFGSSEGDNRVTTCSGAGREPGDPVEN
jgi:predicted nucleotidyltransferase